MKIESPDFVDLFIDKYDIIFLSECWTAENFFIHDESFQIRNYTCFSKHRRKSKKAKRNSGGLCVFIKSSLLEHFEIIDWDFEDGIIFKSKRTLTACNKHLFLLFIYLRPSTSSRTELTNENDIFDILTFKVSE